MTAPLPDDQRVQEIVREVQDRDFYPATYWLRDRLAAMLAEARAEGAAEVRERVDGLLAHAEANLSARFIHPSRLRATLADPEADQ